jgi:Cof subfamily protein (haloacid dehalogenase superfamily)
LAKKLLICDLDGTLLDDIKGLSQKYADKLNSFLDKGIDFTIATGRDFENTKLAIQNTHIQNPIILTNGAIMADFPSGSVIEYLTIPQNTVSQIYEIATKFNLQTIVFAAYDKEYNYPRFVKGTWWSFNEIRRLELKEYEQYLSEPVISIQFMYPKETLEEFYTLTKQNPKIMKDTHLLYFEDAFLPGMYWLEFNPANARKEVMVESLMKLKGFSRENTIIFGDNFNDVGMFPLAGTVVVVENAPDKIKEYADYIVPSNLEGGVLQFIEQHLDELV